MTPRQPTAESARYRRVTRLERLGARAGALIGDGWLRRVLRGLFRGILGWLTGGGARSVLPHGEEVRVPPTLRQLTWNPVEYEAFRGILRPGDVALDVGANIGAYTVLFGQWVGAGGRVISFEPAPDAHRGLETLVGLNRLGGIVDIRRAAVSDAVGEAEFVSAGSAGTNHLATLGEGDATRIRVPTTTLDTVCAAEHVVPRLIKIDVEGAELAVLRGARATLAALAPDAAVFVEMHPVAWRTQGITAEQVQGELAALGWRAVPLRDDESAWALDGECMRLERL